MSEEEIKYHKFLNLLVVIKNSISLICFTILAIIFKKWWIVLFAILFLSIIGKREDKKMNKECYNCANQNNCIRYNVTYGSKYCEVHKN